VKRSGASSVRARGKIRIIVLSSRIISQGGTNAPKAGSTNRIKYEACITVCYLSMAGKHVTDNYHLLQKFVQTPQQLFCDFHKSVGHDEHHCHSYQLMMERVPMYHMQAKNRPLDQSIGGAC